MVHGLKDLRNMANQNLSLDEATLVVIWQLYK